MKPRRISAHLTVWVLVR